MQLVGLGPIAPAPAGPIGTRTGSTWVALRVIAARRLLVRFAFVAAFILAAAALATVFAPRASAADPVPPPVASIVVTGAVHFVDQPVMFSDTSTGESTSRERDFGDGSQAHRQQPEHPYAQAET